MDDALEIVCSKIREAERFNARDESEWCFELADIRKIAAALTPIVSGEELDRNELCAELREGCYTDGCSETKERAADRIQQDAVRIERLRKKLAIIRDFDPPSGILDGDVDVLRGIAKEALASIDVERSE